MSTNPYSSPKQLDARPVDPAPPAVKESPAEQAFLAASERPHSGMLGEMWAFLRHEAKWWLTPLVIVLLLVGVLLILGATGAAPFIYTLF